MIDKDDLLELINILRKVHFDVSQLKENILLTNDEQLQLKNKEFLEHEFESDKMLFEKYIIKINRVMEDFINYKDYNSQYVTAIKNEFSNINTQCDKINKALLGQINYSNIFSFYKRLLSMITNETKDNLFECFKYGNRDYVLFGKNGAGKTTLLKKLSTDLLNTNAVVIPATRDITYQSKTLFFIDDVSLVNAIKDDSSGGSSYKGKSLFLLGQCLLSKTNKEFSEGFIANDTTITRTINIFNSLGVDRYLEIDHNGLMFLYYNENKMNKYSVTNASDGERTIIYLIAATLLSPNNAFIFIDEPENHLNGSLMRKLFDTLKKYRDDVKFIFATHNIPFIESQKNIELIYLEKINILNKWNFKKFKNYEDIPLELLLNIEGTNDDIIFCEGEDMNSYDYKLYKILYPNFQVMPVNGCDNVMNLTRNINKFAHDLKRNAFGIIDNDFKNQEIIEDMSKNKITVLQVNEVENIFLLENSLVKMHDFMGISETIENIKSKIIEIINNKSADIKKDFCTKLFRSIQMKNKIVDVENIESNIEQLNNENKLKFLEKYKEFSKKFDDAIKREEYLELMKLVPGKFILKNVASIFELSNGNAYVNKLLDLISKDEQAMKDLIAFIGLN